MKININHFKKNPLRKPAFAAFLLAALGFSSCSDKNDVAIPDQTVFSIINASPGNPEVDFFIDNIKVGKNNPLLIGDNTGYYITNPGSRKATVKSAGLTNILAEFPLVLVKDRVHSIFVVDSTENLTTFINVIDKFQPKKEGTTGNAQVRFLNLSPGSPELDLVYEGDTTSFDKRAYKTHSGFKYVPAKTGIKLNLRNTQTKEIVATLPDIELKNEEIYSVWSKGVYGTNSGDTTKVFSIKVTRHVNALR